MLPPWTISSYQSEVPEHPVRNGCVQSALVKWCGQPSAPLGGPPVSQGLLGSILPMIGGSSPQCKTCIWEVLSDKCVCRTQEFDNFPDQGQKLPSQVRALLSSYIGFILCPFSPCRIYKRTVWESVRRWVGERAKANHRRFLKGRQLPTTCPGKMRRHLTSEWRRLRHWFISWTRFNLVTELRLSVGT